MTRRAWPAGAALVLFALLLVPASVHAASTPSLPSITLNTGSGQSPSQTVEILAFLTLLSLLPAVLLTMTAFTRIVTVMSFLRSAVGLQQTPPNQVLIGLSLFLTLFVMQPTLTQIQHHALQPYLAGQLSLNKALGQAMAPLRTFMYDQTRSTDLALFLNIDHIKAPSGLSQVPTVALIPAFIISELRTAFEIGVYIYIPFILVDLVVSTILMSMGMMMVPPTLISLPLKLLLFVLANGWNLVLHSLLLSFH